MENNYQNLIENDYITSLTGCLGDVFLPQEEILEVNKVFHYKTKKE